MVVDRRGDDGGGRVGVLQLLSCETGGRIRERESQLTLAKGGGLDWGGRESRGGWGAGELRLLRLGEESGEP